MQSEGINAAAAAVSLRAQAPTAEPRPILKVKIRWSRAPHQWVGSCNNCRCSNRSCSNHNKAEHNPLTRHWPRSSTTTNNRTPGSPQGPPGHITTHRPNTTIRTPTVHWHRYHHLRTKCHRKAPRNSRHGHNHLRPKCHRKAPQTAAAEAGLRCEKVTNPYAVSLLEANRGKSP